MVINIGGFVRGIIVGVGATRYNVDNVAVAIVDLEPNWLDAFGLQRHSEEPHALACGQDGHGDRDIALFSRDGVALKYWVSQVGRNEGTAPTKHQGDLREYQSAHKLERVSRRGNAQLGKCKPDSTHEWHEIEEYTLPSRIYWQGPRGLSPSRGFKIRATARIVFQVRVVAGAPNSFSILPRYLIVLI